MIVTGLSPVARIPEAFSKQNEAIGQIHPRADWDQECRGDQNHGG